jgi:hypothetical protein
MADNVLGSKEHKKLKAGKSPKKDPHKKKKSHHHKSHHKHPKKSRS